MYGPTVGYTQSYRQKAGLLGSGQKKLDNLNNLNYNMNAYILLSLSLFYYFYNQYTGMQHKIGQTEHMTQKL